jgi:hypothetical protein
MFLIIKYAAAPRNNAVNSENKSTVRVNSPMLLIITSIILGGPKPKNAEKPDIEDEKMIDDAPPITQQTKRNVKTCKNLMITSI